MRVLPIVLTALALGVSAAAQAAPKKSVRITSTPPGATVYLDEISGKPLGVTPIRRVKVPYGYREFYFVLEGYETTKVPVNVGRSTRRVTAKLPQQAKVMISAGATSARGAQVLIDGKPVGNVPWTGYVSPGRHQIQVEQPGYQAFGDWVELVAGQILTLPIVLATARAQGTLFVAADVSGATVYVDGQLRGNAPALIELPAGKAVVEVRAPGATPWRKTVEVKAGDKTIVEASLRPNAGPSGTALILSNVGGTQVYVDGTLTGTAPVTLRDLAVGAHIVEGKAEGYAPAQTTVRVNAGEQSVVKLEMVAAQAEFGRISVRAQVPGAQVFVDGGAQGPAPVEMKEVALGPHAIIVRAEGHADFEATCEVKRNQTCSVMATQTALAKLRIVSKTPGARLFVDGKEFGPLPYDGALSASTHTLRVEAPHHVPRETKVTLEPTATARELAFDLTSDGTSPSDISARRQRAERARVDQYQAASHLTGMPPAPGKNRIHIGTGVPYILEGGGTVGLIEHLAVTVGFRLLERNQGIGSGDFLLGAHYGWRVLPPLSLGVQLTGWAGSNMERRGTATSLGAQLRGIATLHFGERAQFSLTIMGEVFRDTWDAEEDAFIMERDGTNDQTQGAGRFFVGGQGLIWLNESVGLWGALDWKAVGGIRYAYDQIYFGAINIDPETYFRLGVTFAF